MQVTKNYQGGGFFGNSQDKFSDMAGSQFGINMAYGDRNIFGRKRKGQALRKEKRYLKKLERRGELTGGTGGSSAARLEYLRNVQKDRAKKGLAAGALAAGLAFGGPALAAKLGGKGLSGLSSKGGLKGLMDLFGKARKAKTAIDGLTEDQNETLDQDIQGGIDDIESREQGGKMRLMKKGGLVGGQKRLDKNSDGKITAEDFKLLRAMLGARLPR